MTYTRKQVVTFLSVLVSPHSPNHGLANHYSTSSLRQASEGNAVPHHPHVYANKHLRYASSRSTNRSVPISDTLTAFTAALPIVAGLLLECGYDLTRRQERRQHLDRGEIQRPTLVIVANTIIFIYQTAVITLLGTHAAPSSGLDCGLHERWQKLFRSKDSEAIKTIQDAFDCCGFANPRDMAWPFPDRSHDQHACESAFGRSNGCLAAWKAEEQQVAGLLIGVVSMVFIWQASTPHVLEKTS